MIDTADKDNWIYVQEAWAHFGVIRYTIIGLDKTANAPAPKAESCGGLTPLMVMSGLGFAPADDQEVWR